MLIRKEHVELLQEIDASGNFSDLISREVVDRSRFSRRVMELQIMGLVKRAGDYVEFTEAGRHLLNAVKAIKIEIMPDPWIDSRIIEILRLFTATGFIPEQWKCLLEERGLWADDDLTMTGREVYEAYVKAKPLIYITPEIAEFLLNLSPGPAPYNELVRLRSDGGFSIHVINALEATGLLKISPPTKEANIFMLTPLGRRVRRALFRIPIYDSVILIDEGVVEALLRNERGVAEEAELKVMHLLSSNGKVTEAGHELAASFRESGADQLKINPLSISLNEIQVLKALNMLIGRSIDKPYPTLEDIAEKVSVGESVSVLLHLLESKELIKRYEHKEKDTYKLTELGESVLKKLGNMEADVKSSAVKAVTYAVGGFLPKPDWVDEARKLGLVHNDITGKGWFLLELSAKMIRKPILTRHDALILHKVPTKGIMLEELNGWLCSQGVSEEMAKHALSECESKGYIEALPNDYVLLSEVGLLMKDVVTFATTDVLTKFEISITPTLYAVLSVIAQNLTELKKVWIEEGRKAKLINEEAKIIYNNLKGAISITLDEVLKSVTRLRGFGLIGKAVITEAGKKLLEAGVKLGGHSMDTAPLEIYK